MSRDDVTYTLPTRRDTIKYGGTVAAGGLLAGCTGSGEDGSEQESTVGDSETEDSGYSATIEPTGTVEFDQPPESVVPALQFGADLMVALGQWDRVEWMANKQNVVPSFFEMVPDFDLELDDVSNLTPEGTNDKELYYEAGPDLLAFDPNLTIAFDNGFDVADVNEIADLAPWFGNHSRRERGESWYKWPDSEEYSYVGMYDQVERYAQLFGVEDQARALRQLHDDMIESIQADLPPEDERPTIALPHALAPRDGDIWGYKPGSDIQEVYGTKQYRDLKINDAYEGEYAAWGGFETDAEGMLEIDPDVIFLHFGITFISQSASQFFDVDDGKNVVEYTMERYRDDPVLSELKAVKNDRLYVGHTGQQGPLTNLYQTEMLAKQLYPDIYGEFPGVNDDGTWEILEDEQLFDRQEVADIINGDI